MRQNERWCGVNCIHTSPGRGAWKNPTRATMEYEILCIRPRLDAQYFVLHCCPRWGFSYTTPRRDVYTLILISRSSELLVLHPRAIFSADAHDHAVVSLTLIMCVNWFFYLFGRMCVNGLWLVKILSTCLKRPISYCLIHFCKSV